MKQFSEDRLTGHEEEVKLPGFPRLQLAHMTPVKNTDLNEGLYPLLYLCAYFLPLISRYFIAELTEFK